VHFKKEIQGEGTKNNVLLARELNRSKEMWDGGCKANPSEKSMIMLQE
jgi:hypothetical protein